MKIDHQTGDGNPGDEMMMVVMGRMGCRSSSLLEEVEPVGCHDRWMMELLADWNE